jgi:hypothetical protein
MPQDNASGKRAVVLVGDHSQRYAPSVKATKGNTVTILDAIDGDTYKVKDAAGKVYNVRLDHGDAFESSQPQRVDTKAVAGQFRNTQATLYTDGTRHGNRVVGRLDVNGKSIADQLAANGLMAGHRQTMPAVAAQRGLYGGVDPRIAAADTVFSPYLHKQFQVLEGSLPGDKQKAQRQVSRGSTSNIQTPVQYAAFNQRAETRYAQERQLPRTPPPAVTTPRVVPSPRAVTPPAISQAWGPVPGPVARTQAQRPQPPVTQEKLPVAQTPPRNSSPLTIKPMAVSRYAQSATKNKDVAAAGAQGAVKDGTVLRGENLAATSYANDPDVKAVVVRVGKGGTTYEYPVYNNQTEGGVGKINAWKAAMQEQAPSPQGDIWHQGLAYDSGRRPQGSGGGRGGNGQQEQGQAQTGGGFGGGNGQENPYEGMDWPLGDPNEPAPRQIKEPSKEMANWSDWEKWIYTQRNFTPNQLMNRNATGSARDMARIATIGTGIAGIPFKGARGLTKYPGAALLGLAGVDALGDALDPSRDVNWWELGSDVLLGGAAIGGIKLGKDGARSILSRLTGRKAPAPAPAAAVAAPAPAAPAPLRQLQAPAAPTPVALHNSRQLGMSNSPTGTRFWNGAPQKPWTPAAGPVAPPPARPAPAWFHKANGGTLLYRQGGVVSRYAARFPVARFNTGGTDLLGRAPQQPLYGGWGKAAAQPITPQDWGAGDNWGAVDPATPGLSVLAQAAASAARNPDAAWDIASKRAYSGGINGTNMLNEVVVRPPAEDMATDADTMATNADTPATNAAKVQPYAAKRDMLGYGLDAARIGLAMLPTKKAAPMDFKPLNASIRPVGVNEGAYELARNTVAQGVRAGSRMQGSSMVENTALRQALHANGAEATSGIEMQRAQALQQDQQRYDQQLLSQEQYNHQGKNTAEQWNTQQAHQAYAQNVAAKAAAMQQSQQNILTRRSTENSIANQMSSQAAFGHIQAQQADIAKRITDVQNKAAALTPAIPGDAASQAAYDTAYAALKQEHDALKAEQANQQALYQNGMRELGWQTVAEQKAQRQQFWNKLKGKGANSTATFKRGGSLSIGETMAVDNNRSQNRRQENALKHIQKLQSQILTIASKAGIPKNKISRYTK